MHTRQRSHYLCRPEVFDALALIRILLLLVHLENEVRTKEEEKKHTFGTK